MVLYNLAFTSNDIIAMAQRANCCVGHMGQLRTVAASKGNKELVKRYTQLILAVDNIVSALCDYDPESDKNILSPVEIQKLLETANRACGCCCNDAELQTDVK